MCLFIPYPIASREGEKSRLLILKLPAVLCTHVYSCGRVIKTKMSTRTTSGEHLAAKMSSVQLIFTATIFLSSFQVCSI